MSLHGEGPEGGIMHIQRYREDNRETWNSFVGTSRNGTFLFHRDYMEYHADRFVDHSLLIRDDRGRAFALLPANELDDSICSHEGLTYGGLVTGYDLRAGQMLEIVKELRAYLVRTGLRRLVYKAIPHIYHRVPAEEDLYALFRAGARLFRRDVSSVILQAERLKYSENRKRGIRRAQRNNLTVIETRNFQEFFPIVERVLTDRHNASPVHTWQEMEILANRFPENIRLFCAYLGDVMLAGVLVYVTETVAHTQYIANTDKGMGCGALDLVFEHLISGEFACKRFFSFGISTENDGTYLNEGLINQKEQFGGRGITYDFYELDLQ
jgi:Acetyltransferase (GNAT) domain